MNPMPKLSGAANRSKIPDHLLPRVTPSPMRRVGRSGSSCRRDRFATIGGVLLGSLPQANRLLADRGYDASGLREAFQHKEAKPCITGRRSCATTVKHDKRRYKRRNHIEIMFGRLTDWRRVATQLATKARKPAFLPSHRQQP